MYPFCEKVLILDVADKGVVAAQTQKSSYVGFFPWSNDKIAFESIPFPIDVSRSRESGSVQEFISDFCDSPGHSSGVYHDKSERGLIATELERAITMENIGAFSRLQISLATSQSEPCWLGEATGWGA
jgi:hypothetical protein